MQILQLPATCANTPAQTTNQKVAGSSSAERALEMLRFAGKPSAEIKGWAFLSPFDRVSLFIDELKIRASQKFVASHVSTMRPFDVRCAGKVFECNNSKYLEPNHNLRELTLDLSLKGNIAIVTGGSEGIGRGISKALVDEGCHVCICSRREDEVQQAAKELEDRGADDARTLAIVADMTNEADRQKLVEETVRAFGTVDILVNNAGTVGDGQTLEDWKSLFELNLFAVVDLVDKVVPHMQEKGWGRIINVSSENGEQPYPDMIPYSASKGALNNFSKGLSKQYAEDGILVNTVSPAFIETPLVDAMME